MRKRTGGIALALVLLGGCSHQQANAQRETTTTIGIEQAAANLNETLDSVAPHYCLQSVDAINPVGDDIPQWIYDMCDARKLHLHNCQEDELCALAVVRDEGTFPGTIRKGEQ